MKMDSYKVISRSIALSTCLRLSLYKTETETFKEKTIKSIFLRDIYAILTQIYFDLYRINWRFIDVCIPLSPKMRFKNR